MRTDRNCWRKDSVFKEPRALQKIEELLVRMIKVEPGYKVATRSRNQKRSRGEKQSNLAKSTSMGKGKKTAKRSRLVKWSRTAKRL